MKHTKQRPDVEITVDNFAGGGGASAGIEAALGRPIDYAINHDAQAIAMHAANHPATHHFCESVWDVNPVAVAAGRPVGLGWFSPDCTYYSKARGGKPFRDRSAALKRRGLAGVVVRWAKTVRPRVMMLENVEEFISWGPLLADGTPCPKRRGQSFRRWHRQIENLGYQVDMRELKACDYGAPTSRKRLFVIARRDGEQIVFPEATHGFSGSPYRTAAEIIDWDIPCPSIFTKGRDLCENTLRRIGRGIQRYVVDDPQPFIVTSRGTSAAHLLASSRGVDEPLRTISAGRGVHHNLIMPTLINTRSGERLRRVMPAASGSGALVAAFLAKHYGGHETDGARMSVPLSTITARDHHTLVYAFLVKYYATTDDPNLKAPMHRVSTEDGVALVTIKGERYRIADIGMRHLTPRELYRAQSFSDGYIIDPPFNGKPMTKTAQVRMCGNSVPPVVAQALVQANLPLRAAG